MAHCTMLVFHGGHVSRSMETQIFLAGKYFSPTEYFAFCFLQKILIRLLVIYFLFHIFFLAANRHSIDTGSIHPHCLVKVPWPSTNQRLELRSVDQLEAGKRLSVPAIIANYEAMKVRDSVGLPDRCRINFYQLMSEGGDGAIISIQRTFSSVLLSPRDNPLDLLFNDLFDSFAH